MASLQIANFQDVLKTRQNMRDSINISQCHAKLTEYIATSILAHRHFRLILSSLVTSPLEYMSCSIIVHILPGCSTSALHRSTRYSTTSLWPFRQERTKGVAPLVRALTNWRTSSRGLWSRNTWNIFSIIFWCEIYT